MTDQILVEHCAPTLAGLKTAGLVNVAFDSQDCAKCEVCRLNRIRPLFRVLNWMCDHVVNMDIVRIAFRE